MGENIEQKLKKLIEIEAEELAELKQKRLIEAEALKKENERRATEKLLVKLRKEKEALRRDVEDIKKKNFSLQLEYNSWERVMQKTSDDLKMAEKKLNEKHEKIWKERELFCDKTDEYLEEYGISSKWWKERINIIMDSQQFDRYYSSRNIRRKDIQKYQAAIAELRREIKILEDKVSQEETEKMKNENLLKELEIEKENLANEVKGSRYNNIIEKTERLKRNCHELTKLITEKEKDLKLLESSVPVVNNTQKIRFQQEIENLKEKEENTFFCDPPEASTASVSSKFFQEPPVYFDEPEKMEISPKEEIKQPDSFLYEMLDPTSIRAAQAKAKIKPKTRSLSNMTPQERIRKLQIGFYDFLSDARK